MKYNIYPLTSPTLKLLKSSMLLVSVEVAVVGGDVAAVEVVGGAWLLGDGVELDPAGGQSLRHKLVLVGQVVADRPRGSQVGAAQHHAVVAVGGQDADGCAGLVVVELKRELKRGRKILTMMGLIDRWLEFTVDELVGFVLLKR